MSDHVVYSKPLILTEERVHEVKEKQARQRALREDLDKQIAQCKRRNGTQVIQKNVFGVTDDDIVKNYSFIYENGYSTFAQLDKSSKFPSHSKPNETNIRERREKSKVNSSPTPQAVHQSDLLPPKFAMITLQSNPLAPNHSCHNVNSIPVDGQQNQRKRLTNCRITSPQRCDVEIRGRTSQADPQSVGISVATENPRNGLLRRAKQGELKKHHQLQQQPQQKQHQTPLTPRQMGVSGAGSVSPFVGSPRTPKHTGGLLPPIETDGVGFKRLSVNASPVNALVCSLAVELNSGQPHSKISGFRPGVMKSRSISARRGRSIEARARPVPSSTASRDVQTRVAESKVEQLRKELENRSLEMEKLKEKEKNWEEQVKQLKIELKNARKKERDLNKLVKEIPRRAETAPDQLLVTPPVVNSHNGERKKSTIAPIALPIGKKQCYNTAFDSEREFFRPISAPSDVMSAYTFLEENTLPPLQESFKCASISTRKTAFGLPEENASRPVLIEYEHLLQFVKEEIITHQQADGLWRLFTNEASPLSLLRQSSTSVFCLKETSFSPKDVYLTPEKALQDFKTNVVENVGSDDDKGTLGIFPSNGSVEEDSLGECNTFETFAELHLEEESYQGDQRED